MITFIKNIFSNPTKDKKPTDEPKEETIIGDRKYLQEAGRYKLLDYVDGYSLEMHYPAYFTTRYLLDDPRETHKELINSGYLTTADNKEQLYTLTVSELRVILKQENLKVSGSKEEIVNRLDNDGYEPEIDKIYTLTDKGLRAVEEHKPWLDFDKYNYPMSAKDFKASWETTGADNGDDIAYPFLAYKINLYKSKGMTREVTQILYSVMEILDRNKEYQYATESALIILIVSLSGYGNEYESLFIPPAPIDYVNLHSNFYDRETVKAIYKEFAPKDYPQMYVDDVIKYLELALDDIHIAQNELNKRNKELFDKIGVQSI